MEMKRQKNKMGMINSAQEFLPKASGFYEF